MERPVEFFAECNASWTALTFLAGGVLETELTLDHGPQCEERSERVVGERGGYQFFLGRGFSEEEFWSFSMAMTPAKFLPKPVRESTAS